MLNSRLEYPLAERELAASTAVGALAFPAALGLAQVAVFRPMKIACSQRAVSSLWGGVAVGVAGFLASVATIKTCSAVQLWQRRLADGAGRPGAGTRRHIEVTLPELAISSVSAMVIFRALGGRFSSVLPSHLMRPGSFAREGILAGGAQNASEPKRATIQLLGRRHGCHTCGRRRIPHFIADHQPPTKLLASGETTPTFQQLLPHCPSCSGRQGGLLATGGRGEAKAVYAHPFRLRQQHLFLPLPLGLLWLRARYSSSPARELAATSLEETSREVAAQTEGLKLPTESQATKTTLSSILGESDISNLVTNFPLFIVWKRIVGFLDSFHPCDAFHVTLWAFSIIAALGTM